MVTEQGFDDAVPNLSIVLAYYSNPQMLRYQLRNFSSMPVAVLEKLELLIVDDCSPTYPALDVASEFTGLPLKVFRLQYDKPWNQDAARNIGAFEARGAMLLLTDIDHVVPLTTLTKLVNLEPTGRVFVFARRAHFSEILLQPHLNSYAISKKTFWEVGGYDEDFWGTYGSDVIFRRQLVEKTGNLAILDVQLELVTKGSISDARNQTLSRSPSIMRRARGVFLRLAKSLHFMPFPRALVNPYKRVL